MTTATKFNLKDPIHFLALGFGSGLMKPAPGTWGTLAGFIVFLGIAKLPLYGQLVIIAVSAVAGIYICGKAAKDVGTHDHSDIVWDEFVGYWIAALFLPYHIVWFAIAFVVFRFFDIVKPFPIGLLDKKVHGGLGIMLDDIIAGFYSMGVMYLIMKGYQFHLGI